MPAASSVSPFQHQLGVGGRLRLLAWNAAPLLQLLATAALALTPWGPAILRAAAAGAVLLLLPPLAARFLLRARPLEIGRHVVGSPTFFTWWAVASLQGLYNRIPAIEETLRLVPGLYSAWLRLWGARIGRLTFWAPGVQVLDRPLLWGKIIEKCVGTGPISPSMGRVVSQTQLISTALGNNPFPRGLSIFRIRNGSNRSGQ